MDDALVSNLAPPRVEPRGLMLLAGLGGKYSHQTNGNIPALWQRLQPHLGNAPGQVRVRGVTFGVCYNMDDEGNFDYLAGVEVSGFSELPSELRPLPIPAQRYAIFSHSEHVSTMRSVCMTIWTKWLPEVRLSGCRRAVPRMLRRELRRPDGHGRLPDMDTAQGLIRIRQQVLVTQCHGV